MNDEMHALLQRAFDGSIDMFEMYVLRNILILPEEVKEQLQAPDGEVRRQNAILKGMLDSMVGEGAPVLAAGAEAKAQAEVSALRDKLRRTDSQIKRLRRDQERLTVARRELDQLVLDSQVAVQSLANGKGEGLGTRAATAAQRHAQLVALTEEAKSVVNSAQGEQVEAVLGDAPLTVGATVEERYDAARADVDTGLTEELGQLSNLF
mmetsp:Transcript_14041/g.41896  ORF Transcript_14041/g.41896 Transcript_14041/m.41896 type:complete len:208 (+) Transcript_14041:425-1048(+)